MRFRFAMFEAGTDRFELLRNGEPIALEPKPLQLLLHLLSRAPDTVPSEELIEVLWPSEAVTRDSLFRAIRLARVALGSEGPRLIHTVRRRGYRIEGSVERLSEPESCSQSLARDAFVGRSELLAALERDADAVRRGTPRAVLLAGEPGIGKTRTAELLCGSESLVGAEIVWGRCLEMRDRRRYEVQIESRGGRAS